MALKLVIQSKVYKKSIPQDCTACVISLVLSEHFSGLTFLVLPSKIPEIVPSEIIIKNRWGVPVGDVLMTPEQEKLAALFDNFVDVSWETVVVTDEQLKIIESYSSQVRENPMF